MSLIVLSTIGYAGGVYYSLVSDNFHDFFTEYVPYGEDAVAYFEEREFKRRFPGRDVASNNWPQLRGENKVTIDKHAGLKPSTSKEGEGSDLSGRGRHSSSKEEKPTREIAKQQPETASKGEKAAAVEKEVKKKEAPTPAPSPSAPAPSTSGRIDQLSVNEATEPVVQNLVKMVNNIITTINASPDASKYASTVNAAKVDLDKIIGEIATLKQQTAHEADAQIKNAHTEFDTAAKELVRRLEGEIREQESKWRDEYETERERLSASYQQKLAAELDAARQVEQSKAANSLLEQEIALQKTFADSLAQRVEQERNGRLAKLDALSTSVTDLETLANKSTQVVDAALRTQHLQVAVEAVRNAVFTASEVPKPFVNELVALKEIAADDPLVSAAIAAINPQTYQRGLPSPAHLIDRFRRVASEVRKASLLPEDAGVASHAASAVLSRFMFAKNERTGVRSLPQGEDVEATLSRAEVLLEEGDLDAAAREMNALKGWAGVLSRDWVAETRRVLEVRMAVEVVAAEARLQSLLVE